MHTRGCSGWPEFIDERGRVACACGARAVRPESIRKRLERVALGARVRRRLRAFWDDLR